MKAIAIAASLLALSSLDAQAGMQMTLVRISAGDYEQLQAGKLTTKSVLQSKRPQLDLDKAWHGLHYLLAQDPWKPRAGAGEAILGGKEIGKDVGYGPAKILSPKEVVAIAKDLKTLTKAALKTRYNNEDFHKKEIYPDVWLEEGGEGFDWLIGFFSNLVKFYDETAESNGAVLIAIS